MQARNPQLVSFVGQMAERAAKRREVHAQQRQIASIMGGPEGPPTPLALAPVNALAAPSAPETAVNALAAPPAAPAAPDNAARIADLERKQAQLEALGTPAALANAKLLQRQIEKLAPPSEKPMVVGPNLVTPSGKVLFTASEKGYEPPEIEKLQNALSALPPGDPRRAAYENRIRILTTREPKTEKEPNKPVEVVGPDGKPIIVSAEEAISKRMTPAKAMEGLAPKEIQKREAEYPKATASIKNFVAKSEQYIKELEKLRDDPGLDSITGTIYGVTPGVISGAAGRRAKAQYDKVFAKGGFQALQDLKAMSPAGGALGNVSNEEGRRLEASTVGGLDRSQDLADVKQGINDYIAEIRGSMKRVRDAYDDTYEYRTTRGGGAAKTGGPRPSLDDIFK
ncbi:MAG: hypothetical protein EBT13_13610 [Rhodobacteraceae bacterium]|nr:hypothetical protein [Paracoccaceae bacterium]